MKALLSMMVAGILPAAMFSTDIKSKKTEKELPRPNILWLTFEDTSPQFTYYEHGDIQKIMRNDFDKGLMNEDQASIMLPRQREYLYDLHDDKWEMVNLADNPRYAKILEKFRNKMLNHILETRDAHFIPEYSYSQYSDQYIPYTLRQNESIYPVEKVLETAMLCGVGKSVIPEQISLLDSGNDIVEYWTALGLFTSRAYLSDYKKELYSKLDKISYPPAQLYLAGALYDCMDYSKAKKNSGERNAISRC